jgi:hypothetical protein
MGKLDGHCLCGTVSYASDADPAFVAICHCNDCQRQTGAAHSIVIGVPADQIEISGADSLKSFTTIGEDHGTEVQRRFCGECGSPVYTENGGLPGVFILKGGTLNDTSWLEPQIEVWGRSAQPWVEVDESRPRMERGVGAS